MPITATDHTELMLEYLAFRFQTTVGAVAFRIAERDQRYTEPFEQLQEPYGKISR